MLARRQPLSVESISATAKVERTEAVTVLLQSSVDLVKKFSLCLFVLFQNS